MDFSVLRQCFSSGTATVGQNPYKARPSQNWPKMTTYDHVHQIFITSCTWFRRGVLCDRGFTIIGSDNGLSPGRRQAITWTNVGILLIGPLGTNFSEMLIEIHTFSFKKIHLKMSSGKWQPFCLSLNVFMYDRGRTVSWNNYFGQVAYIHYYFMARIQPP